MLPDGISACDRGGRTFSFTLAQNRFVPFPIYRLPPVSYLTNNETSVNIAQFYSLSLHISTIFLALKTRDQTKTKMKESTLFISVESKFSAMWVYQNYSTVRKSNQLGLRSMLVTFF